MGCIEKIVGKNFSWGGIDGTPSPFGVSEDYYMSVAKAQKAGFQVPVLGEWMPRLISELYNQ